MVPRGATAGQHETIADSADDPFLLAELFGVDAVARSMVCPADIDLFRISAGQRSFRHDREPGSGNASKKRGQFLDRKLLWLGSPFRLYDSVIGLAIVGYGDDLRACSQNAVMQPGRQVL